MIKTLRFLFVAVLVFIIVSPIVHTIKRNMEKRENECAAARATHLSQWVQMDFDLHTARLVDKLQGRPATEEKKGIKMELCASIDDDELREAAISVAFEGGTIENTHKLEDLIGQKERENYKLWEAWETCGPSSLPQ